RGPPAVRRTSTSKGRQALRMLWVVEATVLLAAFAAAVWLRYFNDPEARVYFMSVAPQRALMVPLFLTGAMMAFGLYHVHGRLNRIDLLLRVALSFAFGGVEIGRASGREREESRGADRTQNDQGEGEEEAVWARR